MSEKKICPKCGRSYTGKPALSREDNRSAICPRCGTEEALDAARSAVFAGSDEEWERHKTNILKEIYRGQA